MTIKREKSDGTLAEVEPIYREKADGTLVEIQAIYREEADGTLTQVYRGRSVVSNCSAVDSSTNCGTQFPTHSVDVTWDELGDGSKVDHVEVWRKTGSGGTYSELANPAWGTGFYTDNTVSGGTTYYYKVRVDYNDGTHSEFSNEDSATTCG